MKYQVKSGCEITYPDGSFRGGRFYIVDGEREPQTVIAQGDSMELCRDRQSPASPVIAAKLIPKIVTKAKKPTPMKLPQED
tara:strand:- start:1002 stop:1244 length:243 start_codon:yes stop_codon:yes gene_type:complete